MEPYRYYRAQMDKTERQVYDALDAGMRTFSPVVRVPRLTPAALSDVLYRLRLDDARHCCYKEASFRAARDAEHADVLLRYTFEPARARDMRAAVDVRVRKLCAPARSMDDAGKLRYVHDLLVDSVRYDKLGKSYAHEVIGPLCHGVGVCEGIAKTAKLLLDELGVEALVVIGEGDETQHGEAGMRHAWNIVRLGDAAYHMDATFDLSLTRCGARRYDYYCLSDDEVFCDHRAPVYPVPACPDSLSYYRTVRLTARTPEALKKLLDRLGKRRGSVFLFRWDAPDGSLPMEEIARVCAAFAAERGKTARLSCNRTQRVVLFTTAAPEDGGENGELYEKLPD